MERRRTTRRPMFVIAGGHVRSGRGDRGCRADQPDGRAEPAGRGSAAGNRASDAAIDTGPEAQHDVGDDGRRAVPGYDPADGAAANPGPDGVAATSRLQISGTPFSTRLTSPVSPHRRRTASRPTESGTRTSYRIRYGNTDRRTDTVSIDAEAGRAIECTLRSDRVDAGPGDVVPQTVPDISKTYSVSIVDSAP